MTQIKENSFDDTLRMEVIKHLESNDMSWYALSKEANIEPVQAIYNFRKGGGLNGENSYKVMLYLDIGLDEMESLMEGK